MRNKQESLKNWLKDYNRFLPAAFAFFHRARAAAAIFALAAADIGLRLRLGLPADEIPAPPKIRSRSL